MAPRKRRVLHLALVMVLSILVLAPSSLPAANSEAAMGSAPILFHHRIISASANSVPRDTSLASYGRAVQLSSAAVTDTATATPIPATYQPGDPITITWPYMGQVWEGAYWDQPDGVVFNELPGPGNRCANPLNGPGGPLTAACFIPANATPGLHTITLGEFSDAFGTSIASQTFTVYVASVPTPSPTATGTPPAITATSTPTAESATITPTDMATATGTATTTPAVAGSATATPTPATYQPGDPITITWPYMGQAWEGAYWDQPDGVIFNELPGPGNRCANPLNGPGGPLTAACFIPANATPGLHTITIAEFSDAFGTTIADQYLTVFVISTPLPSATVTSPPPAIAVTGTLVMTNASASLAVVANVPRAGTSPFRKLIVNGVNFGSNEPVGLFWDNLRTSPLAAAPASGLGSFTTAFTAPQTTFGTHTLIALGLHTYKYAVAAITVQPEVSVAPSAGAAGSKEVTAGFGFGAKESVKVYWDKPPTLLGSTTSSAAGSFYGLTAVTGTVPLSATTGLHYIYAVGQTSHAIGVGIVALH